VHYLIKKLLFQIDRTFHHKIKNLSGLSFYLFIKEINMKKTLIFTVLILFSLTVNAHRGHTDSRGCHKESGASQYHCHSNRYRNAPSCGTSRIRDCNNNCSRQASLGDGDCDAAFNCAEFSYDRWDCVEPPSHFPQVESCGIEKIRDCNNFCNREAWWGDGDCDFVFNCAKLSYDRGDCNDYNRGIVSPTVSPESTPKDNVTCASNQIKNCYNACSLWNILGDGNCDLAFNCTQFSYDKGDCRNIDSGITSPAISSTDASKLRQCIDSKGNITFSDSPCPSETQENSIIEKTLEQEAQEAASQGILKMSEFAYQEAGEYFEQAASLVPIGNDRDLSKYLNLGGYAFQEASHYKQAIALYERALAIDEKLYDKAHPKIANILNNLALLYQAKGDYMQSKLLFERSLTMIRQFFENDHPIVTRYSNNYNELLSIMAKDVPSE